MLICYSTIGCDFLRNKVIFQAINNQNNEAGELLHIDTSDKSKYSAYFENDCQEQFIFVYDYQIQVGTLWHNKKGWEQPTHVIDGKVPKHRLNEPEKSWLKASWNVAMLVETRRKHIHELQLQHEHPPKPIERQIPSHQDLLKNAETLYDALVTKGQEPKCTGSEFAHGWTGFIEFMADIEAKYKDKLTTRGQSSENSKATNRK